MGPWRLRPLLAIKDDPYRAATSERTTCKVTLNGAGTWVGLMAAYAGYAAALELSYCTIVAPVTGRIAHRNADVGNYVSPGQAMFAIVQDNVWVTANFKEIQLSRLKPGQPVSVSVDAVPGVTFRGKVDSFQSGTGSAFSVLPAENATGNWVKVVQRLPVKIVFDDARVQQHFLAPGMSVEPSVTTD